MSDTLEAPPPTVADQVAHVPNPETGEVELWSVGAMAEYLVGTEQDAAEAKRLLDARARFLAAIEDVAPLGEDTQVPVRGGHVTVLEQEGNKRVRTEVVEAHREELLSRGLIREVPPPENPPPTYTSLTVSDLKNPALLAELKAAGIPDLIGRQAPRRTVVVTINREGA